MKTKYLFIASAILAIAFVSCSKDNDGPRPEGDTNEVYIDASSSTTWHYYSFAKGEVVGSGEETEVDNAAWGARTDWDMAIKRYNIRTNSGDFTSVGARGGVYVFDVDNLNDVGNIIVTTTYASVRNVPASVVFATDKPYSSASHGGVVTTVRSDASTIQLKKKSDGSSQMPPVYLKAPVCIFRSADGENFYKVEFTQYESEEGVSGHVKFNVAQIY